MIILYFILIHQSYANNGDYNPARSNALAAFYDQSGIKADVNTYGKYLDDKYVPDYINNDAVPALILLQYINNHSLSWTWRF
jgi:hypothetical protein